MAIKSHKIAHIVPVSCLEKTANNQYHMCLAHLVKQSKEYASFYRRMSDEGKFVLMDNGVAEGAQLSVSELVECYDAVHPTEVVLPDTLLDANDTLVKSATALVDINKYYDGKAPFTFMAVPQGADMAIWIKCMKEMLTWPGVNSIGVPKALFNITGNKWARYRAVEAVCDRLKSINYSSVKEIHLLGCSESTDVIRKIFDRFDFVRGCDSAFVYLMSQSGWYGGTGEVERPEGEIDFLNGRDYDSLEANMDYFNHMVGVTSNVVSDTSWEKQEV